MISPIKAVFTTMLVCLPFTTNAQDAVPPSPEMTTATYRSWTLRCATAAADEARRICEVVQAVSLEPGGSPVAQVAMGLLSADQPMKLVVQLPTGVWLPANVRIDAPNGTSLTANFTACGQLCGAEAAPDEAFIAALKSATEAAVLTFQDGAQRPVVLQVSLEGLTAALAAMEAEMAAN